MRAHSIVGLVTNSSSETFITPLSGLRERMITLIDAILAAGGSTKTANDLFEFSYVMHSLLRDTGCVNLDWVNETYAFDPPARDEAEAKLMLFSWAVSNETVDVEIDDGSLCEYGWKPALDLQIIPKDGVSFPADDLMLAILGNISADTYDWN